VPGKIECLVGHAKLMPEPAATPCNATAICGAPYGHGTFTNTPNATMPMSMAYTANREMLSRA
jgi:hypothetical protein